MTQYDETDYALLEMAEAAETAKSQRTPGQDSGSSKGDEVYELKNALRRAAQQKQRRRRQYAFSRR